MIRAFKNLSIRNRIQLLFFIVTIFQGIQLWLFIRLRVPGTAWIPRPQGVDGFLPIGSLMGWKYFFQTGLWDAVHPSGMVILGFAILISLLLRKSFCGWMCPVGAVSEFLAFLGNRWIGKQWKLPRWADYPLMAIKYLLLFFFAKAVLSMSAPYLEDFFNTKYWKIADIKMMYFFLDMTLLTMLVLVILVLISLLVKHFWCRYLCPYGALMGLFSLISPTAIHRNSETCIDCSECSSVCPSHLPVDKKQVTRSSECTGCMDCTLVCPEAETLQLQTVGFSKQFWSPEKMAIIILVTFTSLVVLGYLFGFWASNLDPQEIEELLPMIDQLNHR